MSTLPRRGEHLRSVPTERDLLEEQLLELAPSVKSWLMRDMGSSDVDDPLQDSLTAIAKALPRFRGDSSVETYAYRITMRIAVRHRRLRKKHAATAEFARPPADLVDPESHAMSREALRALYQALDQLPTKRRRAFVLCCIEGLSAPDAAQREGVRPDAMRSLVRHARAELGRRLSGDAYLCELLGGRQ